MRILFVTQIVPFPPHGGVLQRGFNLLRELGRRHEVHLLAFHHPDELPPGEPVEQSRRELSAFCRRVEYFSLWPKQSKLHKLAAFVAGAAYPLPFSVLAHRSPTLASRIAAECAGAAPPDIVHLDTIALAPYLSRCGSAPAVLAHHNIESQLMARRADYETGPARWYVRAQARRLVAYERAQAARFPLNITVSDADSAELQRICPAARAVAVPNGVDVDYFAPRAQEETSALIYTGGMNMFANRDAVEWFLEAIWPRIKAAAPATEFFAIGQRPSPRVLAAAAADPAIHAPGFVEDVRPWVARSAVYVVPLRVGGGTRLKMVDAMAQGKAIVATTIGAEGIEGVDGEHFVLADEPEQFAQAVIRLLREREAAQKLGAAARQRAVERYAWPILGERLASHYARVIEDSRR